MPSAAATAAEQAVDGRADAGVPAAVSQTDEVTRP